MHIITKWKELIWKVCMLFDSNCLTFWKRRNSGDNKKACGYQEQGEGGTNRQNPGDSRQWNYSLWCDSGGYKSSWVCLNPQNVRGNPNINCGLWVISTCQCRFINCNKCLCQCWWGSGWRVRGTWVGPGGRVRGTWVGVLMEDERYMGCGQKVYGKYLCFPLFCCDPITCIKLK